mmetsp:Transcript_20647/g.52017  ORF Transcript_20647/g.52017 Transcript_20647/m.52017 type:complete len:239 (-) Transcript_20647:57-773(-)
MKLEGSSRSSNFEGSRHRRVGWAGTSAARAVLPRSVACVGSVCAAPASGAPMLSMLGTTPTLLALILGGSAPSVPARSNSSGDRLPGRQEVPSSTDRPPAAATPGWPAPPPPSSAAAAPRRTEADVGAAYSSPRAAPALGTSNATVGADTNLTGTASPSTRAAGGSSAAVLLAPSRPPPRSGRTFTRNTTSPGCPRASTGAPPSSSLESSEAAAPARKASVLGDGPRVVLAAEAAVAR